VFDVTAPAVTNVTATNANGAYNAGNTIHVQLTFSKPVTVSGTPQLTLNTAPSRTGRLHRRLGHHDPCLRLHDPGRRHSASLDYASTAALTLNGGTIRDACDERCLARAADPRRGRLALREQSLTVDTAVPTVSSVSASNADGSYAAGAAIHVRITFSEPVTITGAPTLTLNTAPATDSHVRVRLGHRNTDLRLHRAGGRHLRPPRLRHRRIAGAERGTIRDAATNAATLTLPTPGSASSLGGQKSIAIDTTGQIVTSTTVSGSTLDITYSEPVTGSLATSDFSATLNGSADAVDGVSIVGGNIVRLALHDAPITSTRSR